MFFLSANNSAWTQTGAFNDTAPSSTVFSVGNFNSTNGDGDNIVAYCFAPKVGYSAFGKYTGTGNATTSPFIYTGFKPSLVAYKNTTQTDEWFVKDNKRPGHNPTDLMFWSVTNAEVTNLDRMNIFSNGFKPTTTDKGANASGNNYIYLAFGQSLVGSNNIPCTAF